MVVDYFIKLQKTEPDLMTKLKESEKEFSFESDAKLKESIEEANQMINKLLKTSTRIRKLKLTFTVNDERLINLIEATPEDYRPDYKEMCRLFDKNKMFLANLIYEFEELQKQDLDEATEQLSQKVHHYAGEYINYFDTEASNNNVDATMLEKFFVDAYLYRNDKFNDVLEFASKFANSMLNKYTTYKAVAFLRFCETELISELEETITKTEEDIEGFLKAVNWDSRLQSIETGVHNATLAIDFIKAGLAGKSYTDAHMNNPYLRESSVKLLNKVRELEKRYEQNDADNVIIMEWLDEYIEPLMTLSKDLGDVKGYLKNSSSELSVNEFKKVHEIMNRYNKSRWMVEQFLWSTRAAQKGRFVDLFCDAIAKDLKNYKKFNSMITTVQVVE